MTTTDTTTTEAPAPDTAVIGYSILAGFPALAYLAKPAPVVPYLGEGLDPESAKGFDDAMRAIAEAYGKALDDATLQSARERDVARAGLAKTAPRYDGTSRYASAGEGLAPEPRWAEPGEVTVHEAPQAEARADDEPAALVLRASGKLERIPVARSASGDQEAGRAALRRWAPRESLGEQESGQ